MVDFPNLPNVPGVPPIPRDPLAALPLLPELARDAISFFVGFVGPQWGLFFNGVPVLPMQSLISFDLKREWSIPTYPVEQGGFESYNKVSMPFDVKMRLASPTAQFARIALLQVLDVVGSSLAVFDAVTPDRIYNNVSVVHYDYRRTSIAGVSMIIVDVWCQQIRIAAAPAFTDVKAPAGADAQSGGIVQAVPASAGESSAVTEKGVG